MIRELQPLHALLEATYARERRAAAAPAAAAAAAIARAALPRSASIAALSLSTPGPAPLELGRAGVARAVGRARPDRGRRTHGSGAFGGKEVRSDGVPVGSAGGASALAAVAVPGGTGASAGAPVSGGLVGSGFGAELRGLRPRRGRGRVGEPDDGFYCYLADGASASGDGDELYVAGTGSQSSTTAGQRSAAVSHVASVSAGFGVVVGESGNDTVRDSESGRGYGQGEDEDEDEGREDDDDDDDQNDDHAEIGDDDDDFDDANIECPEDTVDANDLLPGGRDIRDGEEIPLGVGAIGGWGEEDSSDSSCSSDGAGGVPATESEADRSSMERESVSSRGSLATAPSVATKSLYQQQQPTQPQHIRSGAAASDERRRRAAASSGPRSSTSSTVTGGVGDNPATPSEVQFLMKYGAALREARRLTDCFQATRDVAYIHQVNNHLAGRPAGLQPLCRLNRLVAATCNGAACLLRTVMDALPRSVQGLRRRAATHVVASAVIRRAAAVARTLARARGAWDVPRGIGCRAH